MLRFDGSVVVHCPALRTRLRATMAPSDGANRARLADDTRIKVRRISAGAGTTAWCVSASVVITTVMVLTMGSAYRRVMRACSRNSASMPVPRNVSTASRGPC